MQIEEAEKLSIGDAVQIRYTPRFGHGDRIDSPGIVRFVSGTSHVSCHGIKYTWVHVEYDLFYTAVFPSSCLSRI